jgi:hypothetical protein
MSSDGSQSSGSSTHPSYVPTQFPFVSVVYSKMHPIEHSQISHCLDTGFLVYPTGHEAGSEATGARVHVSLSSAQISN